MNKSFLKAVALLVCFGFLLTAVPGLNAAEKKAVTHSLKPSITKSIVFLFPWLGALIGSGSKTTGALLPSLNGLVKPTGDAPTGKPGSGD